MTLNINPMFAHSLGQNQNFALPNYNLYSGLESINVIFGTNQISGDFSPTSLDFASCDSCQHQDGVSADDLALRGSASNDLLNGTNGNDKLFGLAGDDLISGSFGDDLLNGGTGNDRLVGGFGNDVLTDYDGGDVMTGGEGADQFWLSCWDSPDTPSIISDFEVGTDKIKIGRLGTTFDQLMIQGIEKVAFISDQDRILAILPGVSASSLTPENFVFGDPHLADKLQTALGESVMTSRTPGATNAIITPDGFTWEGAAGVSDLKTQSAMQPDNILGIGSITKTLTAATVLKLTEEGTLSLDDTLGKWLPEVAKNIPDGASITIRQLLNGTSGISNGSDSDRSDLINAYFDFLNGSTQDISPQESVASIYGQPRFSGQASSPIWTYPNTGNKLAGLIVEQATGSSFSSVLREQVLKPLGLKRTFFVGDEQISGDIARGYEDLFKIDGRLGQDGVCEDYTDFNLSTSWPDGWADGALYSTAQDVARFSQALFSGELLSSKSLKEMLTFVNEGIAYEGKQYGLGVASFENSLGREWGKGGDTIGYSSQMRYFPDIGGATVVALASTVNINPIAATDPNYVADSTAYSSETPASSILNASIDTLRNY